MRKNCNGVDGVEIDFGLCGYIPVCESSAANVSPKKRVNQTRTNVINRLPIVWIFGLFSIPRLAHNGLVGGSSPPGPPICQQLRMKSDARP